MHPKSLWFSKTSQIYPDGSLVSEKQCIHVFDSISPEPACPFKIFFFQNKVKNFFPDRQTPLHSCVCCYASVSSKHQHPPGRPPVFCTPLLPRGRDLYLRTFPGGRFLHIHKITFSTVKKYTFTHLAFRSYLHAFHMQFRLSILA